MHFIHIEHHIKKITYIYSLTKTKIYAKYILSNLHPDCFHCKGKTKSNSKNHKEELNKYISGIITNKGQKSIIVNGMPDHIHIFVGLQPSISISDLVRDVKNNSSKFINEQHWINCKFSWQEGYGAFSYSHSQIENVYHYILDQEKHHQQKTFKEEYLEFLQKFGIEYNERYLFEWIE